jgi:hypothetical protein
MPTTIAADVVMNVLAAYGRKAKPASIATTQGLDEAVVQRILDEHCVGDLPAVAKDIAMKMRSGELAAQPLVLAEKDVEDAGVEALLLAAAGYSHTAVLARQVTEALDALRAAMREAATRQMLMGRLEKLRAAALARVDDLEAELEALRGRGTVEDVTAWAKDNGLPWLDEVSMGLPCQTLHAYLESVGSLGGS